MLLAPLTLVHVLDVLLFSLVMQHLNLKPNKSLPLALQPGTRRGLAGFQEEVADFVRIQ